MISPLGLKNNPLSIAALTEGVVKNGYCVKSDTSIRNGRAL